ncbi:MAG: hypothetical protein ACFCU5_06420 [Pleurocapsa sp.]
MAAEGYCSNCVYNHCDRTVENPCPVNFFYGDFFNRHRESI